MCHGGSMLERPFLYRDPMMEDVWGGNLWVTVTDGNCTSPPTLVTTEILIGVELNDFFLIQCLDGQQDVLVDLTDYDDIVAGQAGFTVEWYLDSNLVNQITDVQNFAVTGNDSIYAIVLEDPCFLDTSFITLVAEALINPEEVILEATSVGRLRSLCFGVYDHLSRR